MLVLRLYFLFFIIISNAYSEDFTYRIPSIDQIIHQVGNYSKYMLPKKFSILVWNNFKGDKESWKNDFINLTKDKDILILQEYYSLNMGMFDNDQNFSYDIATSFIYENRNNAKTGVTTGSNTKSLNVSFDRSFYREPIINTPKVSILTTYDIENCSNDLLVVNTHAVNFVSTNKLKHQLKSIADKIQSHIGPVIWAGDFNTWSKKKLNVLNSIAQEIGLELINNYQNDNRLRVFKNPLDHIMYRDLALTHAKVESHIEGSDHKPIIANFEINCNENLIVIK